MAGYQMPIFNPYTVASAEDLNMLGDAIEKLAEGLFGDVENDYRPIFRVRKTTDTTITTATDPQSLDPSGNASRDSRVGWEAIDEDSDNMCSTATTGTIQRNTYAEIHTPGLWLFLNQQRYNQNGAGGTTGSRACKLMRNGFQVGTNSFASAKLPMQTDGEGTTLQVFSFIECLFNDKIYVNTWSSVDAVLRGTNGGFGGTWFAGVWLGPAGV